MSVQIVPRDGWARTPKNRAKLTNFDHGWFIHWLGTPAKADASDIDVLRQTQAYHMDTKRWSDIAYSFAIGRHRPERVYELRGWSIAGGHTEGYNRESMALVFLLGQGEKPTATMLNTAREFLLGPAFEHGYWPALLRPHNAVRSTACPGPELTAWAWAGLKPTGGATVPDKPPTDLTEQWQDMLLANGANLGPDGSDGQFGRLTLEASKVVLDHRNQLMTEVADLRKANVTSAETIKRLVASSDTAKIELGKASVEIERLKRIDTVARDLAVRQTIASLRAELDTHASALDAADRLGGG